MNTNNYLSAVVLKYTTTSTSAQNVKNIYKMAIHNQIFHAYRDRKQKIDEAISYLEENDYIVVHKDNLKKLAK